MNSKETLILIAIGPVQPFIAAARKIRDLWYGSHLLSELSKSVAYSLAAQGCDLVFPAPASQDELNPKSSLGVANKIMALAPPATEPDSIIEKAREAYRENMLALAAKARDDWKAFINVERFDAQIPDYGEFYAVWVRVEEGDYDNARQRAETLLAARKATRTFSAPAWNGFGLSKNSLDGARETVISDSKNGALVKRRIIKANEDLDSLGVVKRWGGLNHRAGFDTLSDLAADPYIRGLTQRGQTTEWEDFRTKAQALGASDGDLKALLFEGRLDSWLGELDAPVPGKVTGTQHALKYLIKERGAPTPYACILHADGDQMGKALNNLKSAGHHKLLSRALVAFAGRVAGIVESQHGSLIYSGGDDVLAFLPIDTAVACAHELNALFSSVMDAAGKQLAEEGIALTPRPTLSCGIAIVHHLEPLFRSFETARRAERLAKNRYGKNALAIICDIRGGGTLEIGGAWKDASNPNLGVFGNRLDRLCELARRDRIPGRLAYQLRRVAKEVDPPTGKACFDFTGKNLHAEMAGAEALRVIRRKEGSGAASELKDLLEACGQLRAFADELIVAGHIAKAMRVAEGVAK